MKSPNKMLRDIAAPPVDVLYERAMKDEKTYEELSNGTEVVPIFNPSITLQELEKRQFLTDKNGYTFGTKQLYQAESDFGIDYMSALYQPSGQPNHNFYIDIDTALCTGINGLNDEVAARLVEEIGVPVIVKGPEFSGNKRSGPRRLASVALAALNISQSFSAETSMAISAEIIERNSLPSTAVVYGKSRGAMIGGKKYPYAHDRDIDIIHYRLIDPCVGVRAFESPADIVRYGVWPAADFTQSLPSFAKFALEGKLRQRAKTIETNPAYVTGMIIGTVPSLLSGESMANRIPLHKGTSLVHMANNPIADTDEYLRQFVHHRNFDHHEISDCHIGGIILPRNIRRTVRHLKDFSIEFDAARGNEMNIDWDKVHNNPKKLSAIHNKAA
jgi:hypothetical protein